MYIYDDRLNSFTEQKIKWPHLSTDGFKATPKMLAEAGWFFDPDPGFPDNVSCFLCNKSLGGWSASDDPLEEHLQHSPNCAWAICRCFIKNVNDNESPNWDDEDKWPTSNFMEDVRIKTFGNWWPHNGKKGWVGNVKKMAKAGFHYTPASDSADFVTCIYCGLGLDGWEPRDDPLKEHRRRAPKCPFFAKKPKIKAKPAILEIKYQKTAEELLQELFKEHEDKLLKVLTQLQDDLETKYQRVRHAISAIPTS